MLVAHIMLLWVTEIKTYKISPQNFNICLRLPDITTHLHTRSLKAVRAIEYCVKKSVSSIYLPDAIVHDESPRPFLLIFAYCNQSKTERQWRYGNKTRGYTLHSHWAVNPLYNPFDYCSMPSCWTSYCYCPHPTLPCKSGTQYSNKTRIRICPALFWMISMPW